jgi:hypothetical protein
MSTPNTPDVLRRKLWHERIVITPGGCWLYQGSVNNKGYGWIGVNGRSRLAHRVSYALANGPIPDDAKVCHDCPDGDNPRCVNPDHLWLGTQAQNAADMKIKGRASRIPKARGERNGNSVLTAEAVAAMREKHATKRYRLKDLAAEFHTHLSNVSLIVRHKIWP